LAKSPIHSSLATGASSAALQSLIKDVPDLREKSRAARSLLITTLCPPRLALWVTHHLSSEPDQALVCLDAPTLLHNIFREFSANPETHEALYQNKKAGIYNFTLTLHSSPDTVLPEILGKSTMVGAEDTGLLLPCAKSYTY
jgi:hypothetical protein